MAYYLKEDFLTFSFGADKRLHYSWQYRQFFRKSEVIRLQSCEIFRIPNGQEQFRLGITIKTRVTSIQRNKIKRIIREAFRKQNNYLGSFDYNVVIPKKLNFFFGLPRQLTKSLENELSEELIEQNISKNLRKEIKNQK